MRYIRRLADVGRGDLAVAGGKGANLGELTRAGVPVPPGFVLTTAAYRAYVDHSGIGDEILAPGRAADDAAARIRALFTAPIPGRARRTSSAPPARSSARPSRSARRPPPKTSTTRASPASRTRSSTSGATTRCSTRSARCWASLWTARAIAYRARRGIDPAEVALAVVVQEMVDADAAGVLFTANPTTGARDEVVIAAAWGLGEAVVGGTVTTDDIVVEKGGGRVRSRATADKAVQTVAVGQGTEERPVPAGPRPPRARRRRGGRAGRARRADRGVVRRAAGRRVGPRGRRVRDRAVPADHGAARGRGPAADGLVGARPLVVLRAREHRRAASGPAVAPVRRAGRRVGHPVAAGAVRRAAGPRRRHPRR